MPKTVKRSASARSKRGTTTKKTSSHPPRKFANSKKRQPKVRKSTAKTIQQSRYMRTKTAPNKTKTQSHSSREPVITDDNRSLLRMNKELQVRIKELELELAGGHEDQENAAINYADVSEESTSIIAMVKDLHGEIDVAYELKEALEADLSVMKDRLAEEQSARSEMEAQIQLFETKAALGDQLREDISFVEEERNDMARKYEEANTKLSLVTEERDIFKNHNAQLDDVIKQMQNDKIELEAKALNLEESVEEMAQLQKQLEKTQEQLGDLQNGIQVLKDKLEASESSKKTLERELDAAHDTVQNQDEQIEQLRQDMTVTEKVLTEMRVEHDKQEMEFAQLADSNKRSEREMQSLMTRNESLKKELDSTKKALREIRDATLRTTGRIRERRSTTM